MRKTRLSESQIIAIIREHEQCRIDGVSRLSIQSGFQAI